jgi:hypothetical protein
MIIDIEFSYSPSQKSLFVEIAVADCVKKIDLNRSVSTLSLNFELPICNQTVDLTFKCFDLQIINHPLTITNIVLDEFYCSDRLVYRGQPNFNQEFLKLANKKNMYLDLSVNDSNRLDFTGTLLYQFDWPFYKNIFR